MRTLLFVLVALVWAGEVQAAVRTEVVEYRHGETVLEGYLAYDDASRGLRPGVLVVHEWTGLGPYAKRRAEQLAKLGYIAFAVDMYGKGVRAKDHEEAAVLAGIYRRDRQLMRERITVGLERLKQHPLTDVLRLAAIGYCFGGGTVLELARSGVEVAGVVSFHGTLDTPHPEDARSIWGKVLVQHGADDPYVTQEQVDAFTREMEQAGVDYHLIAYEGAVHSFTVPTAGDDPSKGAAYDADADARSWEAMKVFFEEIFGPSTRNLG